MAGSWQGVARAVNGMVERKERRELLLGEQSEKRRMAMMPILLERMQASRERTAKAAKVNSWWQARLEGLDQQTKDAVTNLIAEDPDFGEMVIQGVMDREKTDRGATRIAGEDLINFSNILYMYKPEGMDVKDFVAQAAEPSAFDEGGQFDGILAGITGTGDYSTEQMMKDQVELSGLGGGSRYGSAIPDMNQSAVGSMPMEEVGRYRTAVIERGKAALSEELYTLNERANAAAAGTSEALSEQEQERFQRLQQIDAQVRDGNEEVIFQEFAPQILPQLSPDERIFSVPEFQPFKPKAEQEVVTGQPVQVPGLKAPPPGLSPDELIEWFNNPENIQ